MIDCDSWKGMVEKIVNYSAENQKEERWIEDRQKIGKEAMQRMRELRGRERI